MRDSFVFYRSFFEAIATLKANQREHLFFAICDYSLNENEPKLTGIEATIWGLIRPQLYANNQRYKNGKKGAEYGGKGGAPKGNKNAQKTTPKQPQNNPNEDSENNPKTTANKNENENENENENDITPHSAHAREEEFFEIPVKEWTESQNQFFEAFDIQIDNYGFNLRELDFDKLFSAYQQSATYLQTEPQAQYLSWICKNYDKIIGGYFKDRAKKPQKKSNMDILRELYDEAVAEEQGK